MPYKNKQLTAVIWNQTTYQQYIQYICVTLDVQRSNFEAVYVDIEKPRKQNKINVTNNMNNIMIRFHTAISSIMSIRKNKNLHLYYL